MFRNALQTIICILLLCSAGLLAADSQAAVRADLAFADNIGADNIGYEYDLADENITADVTDTVAVFATALPSTTANTKHGQPLPGTLLSVLIAGLLMKTVKRLQRRLACLKALLAHQIRQFNQILHGIVSFFHYFHTVVPPFTCCWEWQQTVLRL